MTYEQFCRQLLLCSAIPQSLLTLSMRLALVMKEADRPQLLESLRTSQAEWQVYEVATKKTLDEVYKKSEKAHTIVSTITHGA